MNIVTRLATKADAGLIADLSRRTFYDSFAARNTKEDMDKFMNEQFTKEALMKEVGAAGNIFLLAYAGDEVTGYARMRDGEERSEFNGRSSIEIARIYATQQNIGKGTGSALMKRCIEIARQMNREVIWLGVWEHNQRAIDFYTQWGFQKFGEHDFILGSDVQTDWLMKRNA